MKVFLLLAVTLSSVCFGEAIFEWRGKKVSSEGLDAAKKQEYFDIHYQSYKVKSSFADDYILNTYLEEEAKKKKKDIQTYKKEIFSPKAPSEKELKKYYNDNKSHIPYPFDQVKKHIKTRIEQEQTFKIREDLLAKIKKKGKFKFLISEPVAPAFKIDITGQPSKGNAKAKHTVIEFADFQCPHCKKLYTAIKKVYPKYKSKFNFVYMHFPINPSGISKYVARGSYCADKKGKFWKFHDMAFDNQRSLSKKSPVEFATKLGMKGKDLAAFKKCVDSSESLKFVEAARTKGEDVGVSGTPAVYIDGKKMRANLTPEGLEEEFKKYM